MLRQGAQSRLTEVASEERMKVREQVTQLLKEEQPRQRTEPGQRPRGGSASGTSGEQQRLMQQAQRSQEDVQ